MNIQLLSKQLLEEALTQGTITLQDGTVQTLKATEILSVAKFIVTNSLTTEDKAQPELNMPSEMKPRTLSEMRIYEGVRHVTGNYPADRLDAVLNTDLTKTWPDCKCTTECPDCLLFNSQY